MKFEKISKKISVMLEESLKKLKKTENLRIFFENFIFKYIKVLM